MSLTGVFAVFLCSVSLLPAQSRKTAPASTAAAPKAAAKSALDKPTLEAYLRHQFLLPPNLKVLIEDPKPSELPEMLLVDITVTDGGPMRQQVQFFVTKDGSRIVQGKVFDVRESPFEQDLKLLKTEQSPATGADNPLATVVVFSDFQCQYCKEEAKTLRQHLVKEYANQVRLVFKDMPIEQIHPWAKPAAMVGRCFHKLNPAAFWDYHDWIFEQQGTITVENLKNKAMEFASSKQIDALQLSQCIDGKITAKDVEQSGAEARALQVNSTPTLFVNGRRLVGNIPWEQLKSVLDYEIEHAKKMRAAKEKEDACCEVKLAIPGQK
jgi:protein-disulfide isomerase